MEEVEGNVRQILRIHGIETHRSLDDRLWSGISNDARFKSRDFLRRCDYRLRGKDDYATPMTWPLDDAISQAIRAQQANAAAIAAAQAAAPSYRDLATIQQSVVLERFVPLSRSLLVRRGLLYGGANYYSARSFATMASSRPCFASARARRK